MDIVNKLRRIININKVSQIYIIYIYYLYIQLYTLLYISLNIEQLKVKMSLINSDINASKFFKYHGI